MYSPRRFHRPRPYKVSTWALDSSGKLLTQFPPTVLSDGCFSRTRRQHRNRWTAPTAINQFVPKILPSSTKVHHRTGHPDMKSRHTRAHTSTQNDVIWSQNDSKNRRTSGVRHRSDSWNALQKNRHLRTSRAEPRQKTNPTWTLPFVSTSTPLEHWKY